MKKRVKDVSNGVLKIRVKNGEKRLFGVGPKRSSYNIFYQKRRFAKFDPKEYVETSSKDKEQLAYEDAKNHEKFVKDLIKEGVYPVGTKCKAKRKKHSNKYVVEIFMPKIKMDEKKAKYSIQTRELRDKTEEIAKKYRYKGYLSDDFRYLFNYGVDPKTNKLAYLDSDILQKRLPFKYRKNSMEDFTKEKNKPKNLENILSLIGIITISVFLLFSTQLTGNTISNNFLGEGKNLVGIISLMILIITIALFLKIKKKNQRNNSK